MEVATILRRIWIRSGNVLELDKREVRFLDFLYSKIVHYYTVLYGTEPRYLYPLSISTLKKLCRRNSLAITKGIFILANTIVDGTDGEPPIYFDRVKSEKNPTHRPYRIYLRNW